MNIMLATYYSGPANEPETIIAGLAIFFIVAIAIIGGVRWFLSGPVTPDPWESTQNNGIEPSEESMLCHHCLVPNSTTRDFCENCGAPIGKYTNFLPYPYLFSVGYILRLGTSGDFKRTRLTVFGYVLLAFAEYVWFAPVYLFQFFRVLAPGEKPSTPSNPQDSQAEA